MAELFADLPEALAATVEIAERCAFRPRTLAPILPRFSAGRSGSDPGATEAAQAAREAAEAQELRRAALSGSSAVWPGIRSRPATASRTITSGSPSSSASSRA